MLGAKYWSRAIPCLDCSANHIRAERLAECERTLLLFMETFSKLARQLAQIELEADRQRQKDSPPPPGVGPIPKKRFLLVPAELLVGIDDVSSIDEVSAKAG